jgi:transcription antitermination factor NusG
MGRVPTADDEDQATRRSRIRRASAARTRLADQHATSPGGVNRYEGRMGRLAAVRRRENDKERGWCILRTNGRRTLTLAQSLNAAGIEAWTPRETRKRRLPRGRKGFKETEEPIVPSFVFARAIHLPDLLRVLAMPLSPHPSFSIFQHAGRAPVVADREIAHLQSAEDNARRAQLKTRRHDVEIGTKVCPTDGAFAGLEGVVEKVSGRSAQVRFNNCFVVTVATWLLIDEAVEGPPSRMGSAALAA